MISEKTEKGGQEQYVGFEHSHMYHESKVFIIAERVEQAVLTTYSCFHQFLVTGQAVSSSQGNAEKFCSAWQ